MGRITIRFIGLAVHLDKHHGPELDVHHRVILLANPQFEMFLEHPIEPHAPEIHFANTARLALDRVIVTVPNAGGDVFAKHPSFDKVPRLTPESSTPLPLKREVVYEKRTPAAAYFDTKHGELFACRQPGGAIGTRLVIDTYGPPKLLLTSFEGAPLPPFVFESDEISVTIANVAAEEKDDAFDFLLSYKVLAEIPLVPFIPENKEVDLPECGTTIGGDLGPACSNSSYP